MFWFRKSRTSVSRDVDFEREIESHLQLEEEELRERGAAQDDAHWAARRAFGKPDAHERGDEANVGT